MLFPLLERWLLNFIVIFLCLSRGQFTRVHDRHACECNVVKTSYSPVCARSERVCTGLIVNVMETNV